MTLRRDAISAVSELIQESGAPNGRERVKILEENCARRTSRFQRSRIEFAQLVGEPLSAKPATRPRASAAKCAGSSNLMHASLTDSVAGWKRLPSVRANSSYLR